MRNRRPEQKIVVNNKTYKRFKKQNQIRARINELAKELNEKFAENQEPPILMEVQSGSKYFLVDLHRAMSVETHVDAIGMQTYPKDSVAESPKITAMHRANIENRDLIIIEDIVDSAKTIVFLKNFFAIYNPKSITIVSLVVRKNGHENNLKYVDYYGFIYEGPEWLLGYGMDSNQDKRNLQSIWYCIN